MIETSNFNDPGNVLTIEKLRAAVRAIAAITPPEEFVQRIFITRSARKIVGRLFPVSRNRSRRIHKKLVKRFGDEFIYEPASLRVGTHVLVHPDLAAPILKATNYPTPDEHPLNYGMLCYQGVPVTVLRW